MFGSKQGPMFNPHMAAIAASQAAAMSRSTSVPQQQNSPSLGNMQLLSLQQAAQQRIQAELARQAQQVMQAQARAMGGALPQSDMLSQLHALQPLPRMNLSADGANLGPSEALAFQQNPAMLDLSSAAAIEQANIASLPELQGASGEEV